MTERWKPVREYKGVYAVSSEGHVMRVAGGSNTWAGRVLRPSLRRGYPRVRLYRGGVKQDVDIHRLVVEAFLGRIPDDLEVNHRDGIKTNNCVDNLEVVTHAENGQHAYETGLLVPQRGSDHGQAKLTEAQVLGIRRLATEGMAQRCIARQFSIGKSTVGRIVRHEAWTHV